MVDNFDLGESKYGRIYKVAGPCKFSFFIVDGFNHLCIF